MGTLKPQNNGPLYINTVIGTLAVDGWAVTFGAARRDLGGLGPRPVPPPVPNVTAHLSTASVQTSHYSMWHYNCLCAIKILDFSYIRDSLFCFYVVIGVFCVIVLH